MARGEVACLRSLRFRCNHYCQRSSLEKSTKVLVHFAPGWKMSSFACPIAHSFFGVNKSQEESNNSKASYYSTSNLSVKYQLLSKAKHATPTTYIAVGHSKRRSFLLW